MLFKNALNLSTFTIKPCTDTSMGKALVEEDKRNEIGDIIV